MATLTIRMDLDNDAFSGSNAAASEIARILRKYATRVENAGQDWHEWAVDVRLQDRNGNTVGEAVTEE